MFALTKIKVFFFALAALLFAVVALKGVNGHIKLAFGAVLASITAITLENWSFIITCLWGLMQIGLLIPDYWKLVKKVFSNAGTKP